VICVDDNFSSQQMLPVLLQAVNYAKKLSSGDAIASFGIHESAARITYYARLSVLPAEGRCLELYLRHPCRGHIVPRHAVVPGWELI